MFAMTIEERKELKTKLIVLINKTEEEIESFKDMIKPISPENSLGRISRMDAINNKSVAEAAMRNKQKKLTQMKIALDKIDDESFGQCSQCKHAIQSARLIYMPESSLCVRCASRR
jgi:DnaK suppressor protein